jgi:hypothetical protein
MAAPRNGNSTTSLKWEVELFPFHETYPSNDDFGKKGASPGVKIAKGIKQMNFVRGKGTPDAKSTFTIVGSPPKEAVVGTWIVISSYQKLTEGKLKGRGFAETSKPRFIGQITTVSTTYNTEAETGLISRSTVYQAREWSHALTIPVRLDSLALAAQFKDGFAKIEAATKDEVKPGVITELIKQSFNPFQTAALVLTVIGALQQNDKPNGIDTKAFEKFYEVAVKMPSVPQSLLNRLGISAKPNAAFTSGFMKTIIGVQTKPMLNDGSWNGVFSKSSMTLDDFQKNFNRSPSDRPSVLGAVYILQAGASAWQLLQSYCDPSLNEFYTDFVHEAGDNGIIGARPVMMMRDKPFSMKTVEKNVLTLTDPDAVQKTSSFSKYDNLPRINIPSANISRFSISNTMINSPNYIRVDFHEMDGNANQAEAVSRFRGAIQLRPEMNRFGGYEFSIESNFLGHNGGNPAQTGGGAVGGVVGGTLDVGKNLKGALDNVTSKIDQAKGAISGDTINITEKFEFVKWVDKMKLIAQSWHSYDYRMGSATLILRDDNFSLTCGFNAQFQIGNFVLVGHIETISASVVVDGNGTYITETQVQLSRVVVAPDGNKASLEFINPESFSYLNEDTSPEPGKGPDNLKDGLLSKGQNAVNSIKSKFSGMLS